MNTIDSFPAFGTVIGAVRINAPFKQHYNSYETAAWWEDREAVSGIYPVVLRRGYHYPRFLQGVVKIAAKVTDDYFPGLWGGMPISNEPYKPKHVGEDREIIESFGLAQLIADTGMLPSKTRDFYLAPKYWILALEKPRRSFTAPTNTLSEQIRVDSSIMNITILVVPSQYRGPVVTRSFSRGTGNTTNISVPLLMPVRFWNSVGRRLPRFVAGWVILRRRVICGDVCITRTLDGLVTSLGKVRTLPSRSSCHPVLSSRRMFRGSVILRRVIT